MKTLKRITLLIICSLLFNISYAQSPVNSVGSGCALSFSVNTQSVDVGQVNNVGNTSSSVFSAEQWVMFNTLNAGQTVISRYQGDPPAGTFGWLLYISAPGTLTMVFNNSQILDQNIDFSGLVTNRWYHLALTYNGSVGMLYVDGVLVGSVGTPGGGASSIPIALGSYSVFHPSYCIGCNVYSLQGQLDEVRIWNKALTQVEIRQNMCKKLTGTETGLVGYWRFDDCGGLTATDASGNGNTGTLN